MRSWLPVIVAVTVGVLLWVGDVMSGEAGPYSPNDTLLLSSSVFSDGVGAVQ